MMRFIRYSIRFIFNDYDGQMYLNVSKIYLEFIYIDDIRIHLRKKAKPPSIGNSAFYVKTVCICPPSTGMGSA